MTTQHAKSNAREGDGVAGLPAKWRREADQCPNTCGNEDRGYSNAQYQLADELEAALQAQQGAEPVAWEMKYPKGMPTIDFIAAPEFVRSEQRAAYIASECERLYGEAATFRAVTYARTGAPR